MTPFDILAAQHFRSEFETFCAVLNRWQSNRKEIKHQLLLLADELNRHQKNVNIAQVTGTSTSIVATGLIIGGFAASFFTFGTSLVLSAVGGGIAGLGGLTTAGSGIAHFVLNRKICKKAQQAIDQDQELTKELQECLQRLKTKVQVVKNDKSLFQSLKKNGDLVINVISGLKCLGKSVVADAIITAQVMRLGTTATDLAADTASTVFKFMSSTARVIHIGGFVAGMVFLPLDVYTLVQSSKGLHNGNTSDAETEIRKKVKEMLCPEEEDLSEIAMSILAEMFRESEGNNDE